MKANEIQISDWLYSIIDRGDHTEKKLCKVTGIRTDSDVPLIQCDDTDVWYPLDSYEPIPLTPEILEKNGWIKDGYFYKAEDSSYIQLGELFEHASFRAEKHGIPREIQTSPYLLKYIHQLQHALRLCGIDKTIEL